MANNLMCEYSLLPNPNTNSFHSAHDTDSIKWIVKPTIVFSIAAALLLFLAGYYYEDLGCDGGWYSYPALAKSEGKSVAENLNKISEIENETGIKSVFSFRSYRSIRILYTSLWFKYISKNIYFLKLLSFLELVFLLVAFYCMISVFCKDKIILLLLLGIFVNDKTIVLNSATDFRPDNMVAAFTCLTILLLYKNTKNPFYLFISFVISCLLVIVHVTAVIPFICIILFLFLKNYLNGYMVSTESVKYIIAGLLALIVFIYRGPILDFLYSVDKNTNTASVIVTNRIVGMWDKGLMFMVNKEIYRWKEYFFVTNFSQLIVFLFGAFLTIINWSYSNKKNANGLSALLSIIAGMFIIGIIDPHGSDLHVIPMIPFFSIVLSCGIQNSKTNQRQILYALIILVWISSTSSMALAGKIFINGKRNKYNISKISKLFEDIFEKDGKKYLVLGPTEIWPFINSERNVLIIDETRSGKSFEIIERIVHSIDYVIINKDYSGYQWEDRFMNYFGNFVLIQCGNVGNQNNRINVYKINSHKN
jgi:hypothetical protein